MIQCNANKPSYRELLRIQHYLTLKKKVVVEWMSTSALSDVSRLLKSHVLQDQAVSYSRLCCCGLMQSACLSLKQCLVPQALLIQLPDTLKLNQGNSSVVQANSVQEQSVQCGESRLLMRTRYDAPAM